MTISTTIIKNSYSGDGSNTTFTYAFKIADEDLKLRGSGEIIGTKQTGLVQMKVANFQQHQSLLKTIPELSFALCHHYPEHIEPLIERWLGDGERYINS